jgi:GNAT superfamily N-acetyltransferase
MNKELDRSPSDRTDNLGLERCAGIRTVPRVGEATRRKAIDAWSKVFSRISTDHSGTRSDLGRIMMDPNPKIIKSIPSLEEEQFLEDRLYEFNRDQTGQDDGQSFAFFLRGKQQEIVAGLSGWTWAGACEIRTLWVHLAWRGHGYGRALLESAEREAVACGCEVILIQSYSFQAPMFYRKCGYELAWQLNDFPPGHQHCCLVKRLAKKSR